jgi:hypothetical protein
MSIYEIGSGKMVALSNAGKNELAIGTVLQMNGYNNPKLAIVKYLGMSGFGYGMGYRTINLATKKESGCSALELKHISEKKDNRIALYITDEKLSADEILDLIDAAAAQKVLCEAAINEKAAHKAALKAALPKQYPDLIVVGSSKLSGAALGAKNIKIQLAAAFPGVKFSAKSSYYSGGCSIHVSWTDGPASDEVKKITDQYQEKDFDGMDDSTHYRDQVWTEVFGGAGYVLEQKHYSDALYNATAKELGYDNAVFNAKTGQFDGIDYAQNQEIKQATWKK